MASIKDREYFIEKTKELEEMLSIEDSMEFERTLERFLAIARAFGRRVFKMKEFELEDDVDIKIMRKFVMLFNEYRDRYFEFGIYKMRRSVYLEDLIQANKVRQEFEDFSLNDFYSKEREEINKNNEYFKDYYELFNDGEITKYSHPYQEYRDKIKQMDKEIENRIMTEASVKASQVIESMGNYSSAANGILATGNYKFSTKSSDRIKPFDALVFMNLSNVSIYDLFRERDLNEKDKMVKAYRRINYEPFEFDMNEEPIKVPWRDALLDINLDFYKFLFANKDKLKDLDMNKMEAFLKKLESFDKDIREVLDSQSNRGLLFTNINRKLMKEYGYSEETSEDEKLSQDQYNKELLNEVDDRKDVLGAVTYYLFVQRMKFLLGDPQQGFRKVILELGRMYKSFLYLNIGSYEAFIYTYFVSNALSQYTELGADLAMKIMEEDMNLREYSYLLSLVNYVRRITVADAVEEYVSAQIEPYKDTDAYKLFNGLETFLGNYHVFDKVFDRIDEYDKNMRMKSKSRHVEILLEIMDKHNLKKTDLANMANLSAGLANRILGPTKANINKYRFFEILELSKFSQYTEEPLLNFFDYNYLSDVDKELKKYIQNSEIKGWKDPLELNF